MISSIIRIFKRNENKKIIKDAIAKKLRRIATFSNFYYHDIYGDDNTFNIVYPYTRSEKIDLFDVQTNLKADFRNDFYCI